MKKTLKILMAIILFAVVLTIATSVSAVAAPSLKMSDYTKDSTDDVTVTDPVRGITTYSLKAADLANGVETLTVDVNNAEIDINDVAVNTLIIPEGKTVYLKNSGSTSTTIKKIENSGELDITPANITVTELENKTGKTVSTGTVGKIVMKGGEVKLATAATNEDLGSYKKITVDTSKVLYTTTPLTLDVKIEDNNTPRKTVEYKDLKAGDTYNVTVKVMCGDEEAVPAATDKLVLSLGANDGLTVTGIGAANTFVGTFVYTTDALAKTLKIDYVDNQNKVLASTTFNGITPADPDQNKPADPDQNKPADPTNPEQPANPSDDKKGDLDDAAAVATGDHIIPATALLAVVVVANVVYFAKSKNN